MKKHYCIQEAKCAQKKEVDMTMARREKREVLEKLWDI